ncbi:MAG: Peptidoglycan endopeptidase LytF [Chlamydiae bacterium]|nr:Peptidoglycan endopeptidase LytF [Chlamydiota bacterium]
MARRSYQDPWVKKAKWLTQGLIISGTLNIGLLSTFIYFAMSDSKKPLALQSEKAPTDIREKLNLQELLTKYSTLSFQDLLLRLGNNGHVESGYTRRDLALSCLVAFYHFNLERALGGIVLQKRDITFTRTQEPCTLTIFPGLADYQFQAIVHYAKTEKWPLTSQGLFFEIQSTKPPYDPTLLEAFYLTPEFHFINLLFTKTGINLKKEHIVALLSQGDWSSLSETSNHLRMNPEFTPEERRRFLLELTQNQSKLAAKVLLETDQEYCLKHLDNNQVLYLCNLLTDRTNPAFLKELLLNPRSDEIWKRAAELLYEQAAENPPTELNLEQAKRRFIELKSSTTKPRVLAKNTYTVVTGDSLWKIARAHNTSVQALRDTNHLKTDSLKVGQTLTIP